MSDGCASQQSPLWVCAVTGGAFQWVQTAASAASFPGDRSFFTMPPVEVRFSSMRSCPDVLSIIGLLNVLIHT